MQFRIAWTGDFYDANGLPRFPDVGRSVLEGHPNISCSAFHENTSEITPEQIGDAHGVVVLTPRVTAASLAGCSHLLAIARFGVGYDTVDVAACTRAGVLAIIAAGAVDRSMAEATLTWMLALTHHVRSKDAMVRQGRWDQRSTFMGTELRDRTLGVIGLGGIGRCLLQLTQGLGMKPPLTYDPFVDEAGAKQMGARAVSLRQLLTESDFVSIHCPLTQQTKGLIGASELAVMKSTAYILNTARGGIVDEDALFAALQQRRIAGAAFDCFASEPLQGPPRLAELDNVLLAPHCIGWTEELFRDIGRTACRSLLDLSNGNRPHGVLNPELFEQGIFRERWWKNIGRSP
jgi:phosphoglycerate dehydrogenase-like enzyme